MYKKPTPLRRIARELSRSVAEHLQQRNQPLHLSAVPKGLRLQANTYWLTRALSGLVREVSDRSQDGVPITVNIESIGNRVEIRIHNVFAGSDGRAPSQISDKRSRGRGAEFAVARKILAMHAGTVASQGSGAAMDTMIAVSLPLEPAMGQSRILAYTAGGY